MPVEPTHIDEGELQEALERALADCPMAPHLSAALCNMIGRHMSHHLVDVQREFAAAALARSAADQEPA